MKNKKLIIGIATLTLVAAVGIGGTLAYLTAITSTKTNTFTMGKGITGETEEPGWDEKEAANFVPGKLITKDPVIKNTSATDTDPVYAAAKISYQVKNTNGEWVDVTYDELDKFINIKNGTTDGFNIADWSMANGNTAAYYSNTLAPQSATTAIFTAVEIDSLALTPDQVASAGDGKNIQFDISKYTVTDNEGKTTYTYTTYQMQDFQVVVTGYLVQTLGFNNSQEAMTAAFPEIFK